MLEMEASHGGSLMHGLIDSWKCFLAGADECVTHSRCGESLMAYPFGHKPIAR